jgi:hypothetical protein
MLIQISYMFEPGQLQFDVPNWYLKNKRERLSH